MKNCKECKTKIYEQSYYSSLWFWRSLNGWNDPKFPKKEGYAAVANSFYWQGVRDCLWYELVIAIIVAIIAGIKWML